MLRTRGDKEILLAMTMDGYCHLLEDMQEVIKVDNRVADRPDNSCWSGDL